MPIPSTWLATATMLAARLCFAGTTEPFAIHVVDDRSGRGVPLVDLKTVSNVHFVTDSAGWAAIDDPALLGRRVFFHVSSHGYEYPKDGFGERGTALDLTPGGEARVIIRRLNIAERLYRITGEGIYRDSVILGKPVPITEPLLNGQVTGQDSALAAVYSGKIWWFWGDTNRQAYPLGHFSTAGAVSEPLDREGIDPAIGVNLSYFVDDRGFSRPMVPAAPGELHWIDGLTVLKDDRGRERLIAVNTRLKDLDDVLGREMVVMNDGTAMFETLKPLDPGEARRLRGHPFKVAVGGIEYIYCGESFPNLRVKADWRSVTDPAAYEAYVPADSDGTGRNEWTWTRGAAPVELDEMQRRVRSGALKEGEAPLDLRDAATGRHVEAHFGSVNWNDFRRKWIMIVVESGGEPSFLGEVWYAEADAPEGPWRSARKIVTHDRYSFYNPVHHAFLDQEGGRYVYFEGTYATTFSRDDQQATPRYNYNQIMYRLDLADERLRK